MVSTSGTSLRTGAAVNLGNVNQVAPPTSVKLSRTRRGRAGETMEERRRAQRFRFRQPVSLKIHENQSWREVEGVTENTSAVGVYLTTNTPLPVGAEVEVAIHMPPGLQACCSGRVVRVTEPSKGGETALAVECTSPFSEIW